MTLDHRSPIGGNQSGPENDGIKCVRMISTQKSRNSCYFLAIRGRTSKIGSFIRTSGSAQERESMSSLVSADTGAVGIKEICASDAFSWFWHFKDTTKRGG
jgi:hypothetical protein